MLRQVGALLALLSLAFATPAAVLGAEVVQQTQQTASYKLVLTIGPAETMLMLDQAAGATSGEVMVPMQGMGMPEMSMTDQGRPVNHHLEVHVYDRASGALVSDMVPTITVAPMGGASRTLDNVMAMYGVAEGPSDLHFGRNVYLSAGSYTISVTVGNETATFQDVAIGEMGPSVQMPAVQMPSTMMH